MLSLGTWRFYWWHEEIEKSDALRPFDGPLPAACLRSLHNAEPLPALRRFLELGGTPVHRISDKQILNLITRKLATRELLLYVWHPLIGGGGSSQPDESAMAPAFPIEERRAGYAPAPTAGSESPLFPDDALLAAIAAVLKDAAAKGLPFCEECARLQAERQRAGQ